MVTAGTVLDSARSHLNDELGLNWPDHKLFPKLQEAHRELQSSLVLAGVPLIDTTSLVITVPPFVNEDGNLNLSTGVDSSGSPFIMMDDGFGNLVLNPSATPNYPTDIIEPLDLFERQVGQYRVDFVKMNQVEFLPDYSKDTFLRYWSWNGEAIILLGATVAVQVKIHYRRQLQIPTVNSDSIGVTLGETFLSYKTALLALQSADFNTNVKTLSYLEGQSEKFLSKIVRINIKEMQNNPVKRIPYHRQKASAR